LIFKNIKPSELKSAKYNPRRIGKEQLERLAKLIDAHGFICPVIARAEDLLILGGHQRIKALKYVKNPPKTVPVVLLDKINDIQAKQINIALNNREAQGEYDTDMLTALIKEINTADLPELTAFTAEQIEDMLIVIEDINIDSFIETGGPQENNTEKSEQAKAEYRLTGLKTAFTKKLIDDIKRLVCPEGIQINEV
jgi:ParB-like chromosome segregation protein Spo0J